MEDLEQHVYSRLVLACHLFPSISPWNVWDLRYDVWLMFAGEIDRYAKNSEG